jgi:hypothetical protein
MEVEYEKVKMCYRALLVCPRLLLPFETIVHNSDSWAQPTLVPDHCEAGIKTRISIADAAHIKFRSGVNHDEISLIFAILYGNFSFWMQPTAGW